MPRRTQPLSATQIKSAKPGEKPCTLFDGGSLFLEVMSVGLVNLVRASRNAKVQKCPFSKKSAGNNSLKKCIEKWLRPCIGECEISIFDETFAENPHGWTQLSKLRASYGKDDSEMDVAE